MNNRIKFLPIIALVYLATSCIPNSRLVYVQTDKELHPNEEEELFFFGDAPDNTIRPGDELYVRVTSSDDEPTSFPDQGQSNIFDPTLISYTVDEEGYIKLPYIQKVKVRDLTLPQASDTIEHELSQYLYFPSVFIKFVGNRVTILGEVNQPGVYIFNYRNINILQAVGYAGDITEWGNRQRVLLIREDGNRKMKKYVDVTQDDLLTSDYFLLKSNDIVYVEPLKRKRWGMNMVPYSLILSVISTAIVIMTFINTNNP